MRRPAKEGLQRRLRPGRIGEDGAEDARLGKGWCSEEPCRVRRLTKQPECHKQGTHHSRGCERRKRVQYVADNPRIAQDGPKHQAGITDERPSGAKRKGAVGLHQRFHPVDMLGRSRHPVRGALAPCRCGLEQGNSKGAPVRRVPDGGPRAPGQGAAGRGRGPAHAFGARATGAPDHDVPAPMTEMLPTQESAVSVLSFLL